MRERPEGRGCWEGLRGKAGHGWEGRGGEGGGEVGGEGGREGGEYEEGREEVLRHNQRGKRKQGGRAELPDVLQ